MIKTVIFKFVLALYFIIWTPILLVGTISERLIRFLIRIEAAGILLLARWIVNIRYQMHYQPTEENGIPLLPNGNVRLDGKTIIAAKHMSILEVAILVTNIPNAFFIIKRELMWIPIYGWVFWRMGLQPVNRSRGATNMQKLAEKTAKKIKDNRILIIFPEGTRVPVGKHPELKRGLLYLAKYLKLPISPIGTDTGKYWPQKGLMHSGTANLYFEPELPCSASLETIKDAINRHSA